MRKSEASTISTGSGYGSMHFPEINETHVFEKNPLYQEQRVAENKERAPARIPIRRVNSVFGTDEAQDARQRLNDESSDPRIPIRKVQSPQRLLKQKKVDLNESGRSLQSNIGFDFNNEQISSTVLFRVNPIIHDKKHQSNNEQKHLLLPQAIASECVESRAPKQHKLMKRLSLDVTYSKQCGYEDFYVYYELKITGVTLMQCLIEHADILYPSQDQKHIRDALTYIVRLKGLLILLEVEKIRREQIQFKEKNKTVEFCSAFITQLYNQLFEHRQHLTKQILKVSESNEYQIVAKKILDNPSKTFKIFTLKEIEEAYRIIIYDTYSLNNKLYNENKSQNRLRLGLLLMMCRQGDKIFLPEDFTNYFNIYFEYRNEKLKQKFLTGFQISNYIFDAHPQCIITHHRELRKALNIKSGLRS